MVVKHPGKRYLGQYCLYQEIQRLFIRFDYQVVWKNYLKNKYLKTIITNLVLEGANKLFL